MPSTIYWRGGAAAVAQVDTVVVGGTWATNDVANLLIAGKTISFTVGATQTVAAVVAGLVAAWSASTAKECLEVMAANASPNVTLTAKTAGLPFTVTVSKTSTSGTITTSTTTANAGPNVYAAANFSGGVSPVTGDTLIIENSDVDILYGLAQSAVTLASLRVESSYTGNIGLPATNAGSYPEYRPLYLAIGATALNIETTGNLCNVDNGSAQTAVTINSPARSLVANVAPIGWNGTHASNVVTVNRGNVGIAKFTGETAVVATLNQGYINSRDTDSVVACGSGVTLGTVNKTGGTLTTAAAATTIVQNGGIVYTGGAVTTLTIDGGKAFHVSTGTIATVNVSNGAVLDFRQDTRARTVTNCTLAYGGTILDPGKTVTWTNGIDVYRCAISNVTLDLGVHLTVTPSVI